MMGSASVTIVRPPLDPIERERIDNGTRTLQEYIHLAEAKHKRVPVWVHLAANGSCIHEGT